MSKANLYWQDLQSDNDGEVIFSGSFTTDTANPPTDVSDGPYTVVRTGTGVFKALLREAFTEIRYANCYLEDPGAADRAIPTAVSAGAAGANAYAEFTYESTAGTPADAASKVVRFCIVARKSGRRNR